MQWGIRPERLQELKEVLGSPGAGYQQIVGNALVNIFLEASPAVQRRIKAWRQEDIKIAVEALDAAFMAADAADAASWQAEREKK